MFSKGTCVGKALRWFAAALFVFLSISALAQNLPLSQHVVLVIDENHSLSEVLSGMNWLVGKGNANGYANNYFSDSGGSLMDYLWLASGSCQASDATCAPSTRPSGTMDFGCNGNDCSSPITDNNIFRIMNNLGITWKVYTELYNAVGATPTAPDQTVVVGSQTLNYYRRHNGATWYSDILSGGLASHIVDFSQFATDLTNNNLPRFSIIVPDGQDDAHDGSLGQADTFLQNNLTPMLQKPWFTAGGDGVLIVTFDECGGGTNEGCNASVYTAVIGPKVNPGTVSNTVYKHENTLRTIMDLLGAGSYPGAAANVGDMSDFFTTLAGNIDDMPFACHMGNCSGSIGTDTSTQLDGRSLRVDLNPNGVPFTDIFADSNPVSISTSQTNYSLDFWANISVGANSQAVEFSMIQDVGGLEYSFQHQCDFGGTGEWRVWNPSAGSNPWVDTGRGCVVFSNNWNHFILQFQRNSSNQLVYTGITINNVFYSWNSGLVFNATSTSNPNQVIFRTRAVGIGGTNPPSYTLWIDQWNLN